MNVIFQTPWGEFEWDREKDASNLKKHGIAFADAVGVFLDDMHIDLFDDASDMQKTAIRR